LTEIRCLSATRRSGANYFCLGPITQRRRTAVAAAFFIINQ